MPSKSCTKKLYHLLFLIKVQNAGAIKKKRKKTFATRVAVKISAAICEKQCARAQFRVLRIYEKMIMLI